MAARPVVPSVADPGDLDRGRLAGEHQQPVAGPVAGQVEEDVDLVGADLLGEPLVGKADTSRQTVPPPGSGPSAIRLNAVRVADDLALVTIQVLQDADQKVSDWMPAEVGGEETDAQPPIWVAVVAAGSQVLRSGTA